MRSAVFKERALAEGLRYAKDKMVFLREFCQNARDAGASRVEVSTHRENGLLFLAFEDDGCGMTLSHAKQFLFTLYASSKEEDPKNAGRFGVGFWSVLPASPCRIEVESMARGDKPWKVVLNRDLTVQTVTSADREQFGTRILIAFEQGAFADLRSLNTDAEKALLKYCCYLRRNTKKGGPLPIRINGLRMNRPLSVDGPHYMTFDNGPVQGAVGLSETPSVSVFARGLLVWQGTVIDELRYGTSPRNTTRRVIGLSPCYVLNGDRLNTTLDRRAIIDDEALAQLRSISKARMDEFLTRYLDTASPMGILKRIGRGIAETLHNPLRLLSMLLILVALLVGAGAFFYPSFFQALLSPETEIRVTSRSSTGPEADPESGGPQAPPWETYTPLRNNTVYMGPTVGGEVSDTTRIFLAYRPGIDTAFRITAAETLHPGLGIVPSSSTQLLPHPSLECTSDCLQVAVTVDVKPGLQVLPLPTGYAVQKSSVRLSDTAVGDNLFLNEAEEPLLRIPRSMSGIIAYTALLYPDELSPKRRRTLTSIPQGMSLPGALDDVAASAHRLETVEQKVNAVSQWVKSSLRYDDSQNAARVFRSFHSNTFGHGWLEFVLGQKRGDCDVMNTVLTVLLRRLNIPARLAVGPLGRDGELEAGIHAWTEYFDDGWKSADATAVRESNVAGSSPVLQQSSMSGKIPSPIAPLQASRPVEAHSPILREPEDKPDRAFDDGLLFPLICAAALLLFGATVLVFSKSPTGALHLSKSGDDVRADAAKMAAAALSDPDIFSHTDLLFQRPLLATWGKGRKISIEQAMRLADAGRLYTAAKRSSLTDAALAQGTKVLTSIDPAYKEVAPQLRGVIDLDAVVHLSPLAYPRIPSEYLRLRKQLEIIDKIIAAAGLKSHVEVRLSLRSRSEKVRDVSLPGIYRKPIHKVVVPYCSPLIRDAESETDREDRLAAAFLLFGLINESDLLADARKDLLYAAAAHLFEVQI